jgi:2,4-dienoyl-CoA reductase-like NADH-dependent reductase (Old Yellow Enzyme family)
MARKRFERLLEPGYIGSLKTRNRMVKSGSDLFRNDWERFKSFYEALARGGIGLLITGAVAVDSPLGHRGPYKFHIEDDKYIPDFAEVVRGAHKHGCPILLQLWHAGPGIEQSYRVTADRPSREFQRIDRTRIRCPRALTIAEIGEIEDIRQGTSGPKRPVLTVWSSMPLVPPDQ